MSNHHEYTITFPRASCPHYKTFKYCPSTRKICLPDVLLLIGKQPRDYIERFLHDEKLEDVVAMFRWQMQWPEIMETTRERQQNPVCSVCGVRPPKTQRCAACFRHRVEVVYCSAECRDRGWPEHKRVCLKKADPSTLADLQHVVGAVMRIKQDLEK